MSDDQGPEDQFGLEAEESSTDGSQLEAEAQESIGSEEAEPSRSGMEEAPDLEMPAELQVEEAIEPEPGAFEVEDLPAEIEAEGEAEVAEPDARPESRLGRFLKRILRWTVFVLLVFALGVLAMQFVRVQPQAEEITSLSQSLDAAETAQAELQSELALLEGVEAENEELSESLAEAEAKLVLLDILIEITQAQLALAQEDPAGVAAALRSTGEKLTTLRDLLGSSEAVELEALRDRLVLVLSEVDSDPFAAERDLEILANSLQQMEEHLSGR